MIIVWSDHALDDLMRVQNLYAGRDPDLGDRATKRLLQAAQLILRYPFVGTRDKGLRRRRVGGAPFLIFFRETGARIEIVRIVHVRSDWQSLL